jgi:hypothetical protein
LSLLAIIKAPLQKSTVHHKSTNPKNTTMTRAEIENMAFEAALAGQMSENAPREIGDVHPQAWLWWANAYREGESERGDAAIYGAACEQEYYDLHGD